MGPNPNGPLSVSCDRAIRYSGFFGVRSVGPVGDFLGHIWLLSTQPQSFTWNSPGQNQELGILGFHLPAFRLGRHFVNLSEATGYNFQGNSISSPRNGGFFPPNWKNMLKSKLEHDPQASGVQIPKIVELPPPKLHQILDRKTKQKKVRELDSSRQLLLKKHPSTWKIQKKKKTTPRPRWTPPMIASQSAYRSQRRLSGVFFFSLRRDSRGFGLKTFFKVPWRFQWRQKKSGQLIIINP